MRFRVRVRVRVRCRGRVRSCGGRPRTKRGEVSQCRCSFSSSATGSPYTSTPAYLVRV